MTDLLKAILDAKDALDRADCKAEYGWMLGCTFIDSEKEAQIKRLNRKLKEWFK